MIVFYTDLDGTLLDAENYDYRAASSALEELNRREIPVVFCTSKTRSEVEMWRKAVGNTHPYIVENGGAVVVPEGYFPFPVENNVIELGVPHAQVLAGLKRAARKSWCKIRGFSDMTPDEVAERCGLTLQEALLASRREYDEPFEILEPARTGDLLRAIEEEELQWTRGDVWYHVAGGGGKARAVQALNALYRRIEDPLVSVGLGDGLNDAEFLRVVDSPWIVRSRFAVQLKRLVPNAGVTRQAGPEGWNEAVWEELRDIRAPVSGAL